MVNAIVVPNLKLVVETDIDSIEEHEMIAFDQLVEQNDLENIDLENARVNNFTVSEICSLASTYNIISDLSDIEIDSLLLYWLDKKKMEYSINYDVDIEEYEKESYYIIKLDDQDRD